MSDIKWIVECWGIMKNTNKPKKHKYAWAIVYGDDAMAANSGLFCSKRRAKKEITHYINRGASKGPAHGIYKYFDKTQQKFI